MRLIFIFISGLAVGMPSLAAAQATEPAPATEPGTPVTEPPTTAEPVTTAEPGPSEPAAPPPVEPPPVDDPGAGELILVSGDRAPSYQEGEASVGTKVSAPLRDLPQSVKVLPRQVLDDQDAVRPHDLVQNVSGVHRGNAVFGDSFIFRGFATNEFLRDGYPDRRGSMRETANVEQVEALKGPASMLFGRLEPGGTLNYVLKRPLFAPLYALELTVDSHLLVRPTFDISEVTADKSLGVRINGAYEHGGNFREDSFSDRAFGSAAIAWRPRKATQVTVDLEYLYDRRLLDRGVPRFGRFPAEIPIDTLISEPGDDRQLNEWVAGYTVEHQLSSAWRAKHALRVNSTTNEDHRTRFLQSAAQIAGNPTWDGNVNRDLLLRDGDEQELTTQLELIGDAALGPTNHRLLTGLELDLFYASDDTRAAREIIASNAVNIYNPVLGNFAPGAIERTNLSDSKVRSIAAYVQDLISLSAQWKLLVGARLDVTHNSSENRMTNAETEADANSLSPRAGVVWQPAQQLSLYTSYSQSFVPVIGQDFEGNLFDPTKGKQVEAGAKADLFDGRLSTTVSAFRIVKENITVPDPMNTGFNLQTGEITSDGIEVDVVASPIEGLNLLANLSLIDARTTEDTNAALIGLRPSNTPAAGAGIWASYRLPVWNRWVDGLGVGAGGHYVGRRNGDRAATFFLPAYTRWDASVWYRRDSWKVSVKAENLLDKRYYVSSHDTLGIYPGAPFELKLSLGYQY